MDHLYLPTSEEGRRQLQQNAAKFAKEITNMLWRVPRPLLLLLKTNDCLRTVDGCLGQARLSSFSKIYIVYNRIPVMSWPPYPHILFHDCCTEGLFTHAVSKHLHHHS